MTEHPKIRIFLAVTPPTEELLRIQSAILALHDHFPAARWIPPDNQHVTIKFFGSVEEPRVQPLVDACSSLASSLSPIPASVRGLGVFPATRRATVFWAGIVDESGGLVALEEAVATRCAELGWPREKRPFHPHLTLARFREPTRVDPTMLSAHKAEGHPWTIDRMQLYRSRLSSHGARYEVLHEFVLGGRST